MKRTLKVFGIVVLVLFLAMIGAGWYIIHRLNAPIAAKRQFLLHDVDYHAVSIACLELMTQPQYKTLIDQAPHGDDPRLPPAIQAVKAFWVMVETNDVLIMETGGFYHMGLDFHQSATDSNAYELVFGEGDAPDHHDTLVYTLHYTNDAPNTTRGCVKTPAVSQ